jgi:hypothetical protein
VNPVAVLPVAYLAPLQHYSVMLNYSEMQWDIYAHFHKQHYYNRCVIYGANGPLKLIVPIDKRSDKTPLKEVRINYTAPWQTLHWRSFEASYRRSPYFEYYEHELAPLYQDYQPDLLLDWNMKLFETINKLLKLDIKLSFTSAYEKSYEHADDYRNLADPKECAKLDNPEVKYIQVFEEKYGFIYGLSIIDLLFCEGPQSKQLLQTP